MCGCNSGGGGSGGAGAWGARARYQVVSNGFTVSYGSMADAQRHQAAHGGQIQVLKPGQSS